MSSLPPTNKPLVWFCSNVDPNSRPKAYYDVTNLVDCLSKQTPAGIDRVDWNYARFLSGCKSLELSAVYVKGNSAYKISPEVFKEILQQVRQIWIGKKVIYNQSLFFADNALGIILRFRARWIARLRGDDWNHAYYINVSQRNLASPAVNRLMGESSITNVFVIHDLLPITHGQFFEANSGLQHEDKLRAIMKNRGVILCGSQTVATELTGFARQSGFPDPVVIASRFGCKRFDHRPAVNALSIERPFFMTIGTFEPRKNHLFLLDVWSELIRRLGLASTPQLLMVGRRGRGSKPIEKRLSGNAELAKRVSILESLSDVEISGLVANAEALLMPTVAEGYGLPLYEAFAKKIPVIASDISVFRELDGCIARLLPINDLEQWSSLIDNFKASGEQARQRSLLQSWERPTWADHFRRISLRSETSSKSIE
jgi:glycosyltransferase involved in cell wall biosynthesis